MNSAAHPEQKLSVFVLDEWGAVKPLTRALGLGSSAWGIRDCKDLLCSQLQPHNPTKKHSKRHELVLLRGAAGFKFAQVLPSKLVNKSWNASLRTHQASPWRGARPVGVHLYNMEKVTFYLHSFISAAAAEDFQWNLSWLMVSFTQRWESKDSVGIYDIIILPNGKNVQLDGSPKLLLP